MDPLKTFLSASPLPWLVLIPMLGGLLLALVPKIPASTTRVTALAFSLLSLLVAIVTAYKFDWANPSVVQMPALLPWIPAFGINLSLGADSLSLWLVLLSSFLMPLALIGARPDLKERSKEYFVWLLLLQAAIAGTFLARDLIVFYVCFEFTLIPLYILTGVFGTGDRNGAANVFFVYTFSGSMLTLAGVLYVAWVHSVAVAGHPAWSFDIQDLISTASTMTYGQQTFVFLTFMAGFAVKIPVFPFHTIPTLAYPSSPTAGSVFLAAILAKMGTYGLIRFAFPFAPAAAQHYAPLLAIMAIIGILYCATVCWAQRDMKRLVAFSSISHLGFVVLGICALDTIGISGSIFYMISHGVSIAALFLTIGMLEERLSTREMPLVGGLAKVLPVWSFFMVFFCIANVGLPGLNGFIGEFLTLLGTFTSHQLDHNAVVLASIAGGGMILSAVYTLYMVGRVVFGPLKLPSHYASHGPSASVTQAKPDDLCFREIVVLAILAIACLTLGLFPSPLLRSVEPTATIVSNQVNSVGTILFYPPLPVIQPVSTTTDDASNVKPAAAAPATKVTDTKETPAGAGGDSNK